MLHDMKLRPGPFDAMAQGRKTIEMRLHDEKRRLIRVGDKIRFSCTADSRTLTVTVKALHPFPAFSDLYAAFPREKLGYSPGEPASPADMEQYYSREQQARYGVLGIEIEPDTI